MKPRENALKSLAFDDHGLATWSYGYQNPEVLFLSCAAGSSSAGLVPEIDAEPGSFADWSGHDEETGKHYPIVKRLGYFLIALRDAGLLTEPRAAICDISPMKIPSGQATTKQQLPAWEAALSRGVPNLRRFLEKSPPRFLITCDTWFEASANEEGESGSLRLLVHPDVDDEPKDEALHITNYTVRKHVATGEWRKAFEDHNGKPPVEEAPFVARTSFGTFIHTGTNFSKRSGTDEGWQVFAGMLAELAGGMPTRSGSGHSLAPRQVRDAMTDSVHSRQRC